jgi:membrane protein YqaA with SNARE-associated domain
MVADGARADLMKRLLDEGRLPNIKRHIADRGCFRTALTVYPSTTGPAHIPFVCGLHPGTANIPGYRWLDRHLHDSRRRSIYRHRSLNSPRGLMVGRDMDRDKSLSLFEYFDKPSSILELIDYCPNQKLYKVIVRRLFRIVQAHKSDDWSKVDETVERLIIKRIRAGSECIVGSFFGIDEYSHLYDPFDERTIDAYLNIDRAIGEIADVLIDERVYDETIIAVVSDHGLSGTTVHIPLVDITREHGYKPFHYPHLYRRSCDSAVCESGNSMAQIYLKRGKQWGDHWTFEELTADPRARELMNDLVTREGISFVATRAANDGIVFKGRAGTLRASRRDGQYDITVTGDDPLKGHPVGKFTAEELFRQTYGAIYPDAVHQLYMLTAGSRSGDIIVNAEPGFDLRLQHEDPEHHGSHGSLHQDHMQVPLITSFPIVDQYVSNCDLVPTILSLCGKKPERPTDGRVLDVSNRVEVEEVASEAPTKGGGLTSVLVTLAIILCGIALTAIFKEDILFFGEKLMTRYGQQWVDLVLFLLTAVSSSPLALPIWAYAMVGVSLGYGVPRLAVVMALGSATGSLVTFLLGRYFAETDWLKKRFPKVKKHPWTYGKSRWYVTMMLFLGTASPIPCDVFYVACGIKRYPVTLFWITMVAARLIRYLYLGYIFKYAPDLLDKLM